MILNSAVEWALKQNAVWRANLHVSRPRRPLSMRIGLPWPATRLAAFSVRNLFCWLINDWRRHKNFNGPYRFTRDGNRGWLRGDCRVHVVCAAYRPSAPGLRQCERRLGFI